jgi:hypothetical protein
MLSTRNFWVRAFCGAMLACAVWGAWDQWKKTHPARTAQQEELYDICMANNHGNRIMCDALLRMYDRVNKQAAQERQAVQEKDEWVPVGDQKWPGKPVDGQSGP